MTTRTLLFIGLAFCGAASASSQVKAEPPERSHIKKPKSGEMPVEHNWYFAGLKHLKALRFEEARVELAKAFNVKPENPMYRRDLGECLILMGNHKEALSLLEQYSIEQGSEDPRAYTLVGLCYAMLGRYQVSREMLTKDVVGHWFGEQKRFLSALPNRSTPSGLKSTWLLALARDARSAFSTEIALTYYDQALALTPTNPLANNKIGILYHAQGRFTLAKQHHTVALKYASTDFKATAQRWLSESARHEPGRLESEEATKNTVGSKGSRGA